MTDAPADLLDRTAALVAVRSESFEEQSLADLVEQELRSLPHLVVDRVGDNVVARTDLGRPLRVVLGGHTDTVPANGNEVPRLDGDVLWGLGAADMKGGLAVMLELARRHEDPAVDVTYVFYAREEVAASESGLLELERERPDLLVGDAAVLGEPTDGSVEAGCQGVLRLRVTMAGARAHAARAWMGRNAIHRLGRLLAILEDYEPRQPVILGCQFHEALLATHVEGGVAGNVVPDRATADVVHRFAPDRDLEQAEAHVREVLAPVIEDGDTIEVLDRSPAAWPALEHPVVSTLVRRHGLDVRAKLGWTDVARFTEWGVPAINLGPGRATLAHTAEERVERASLERTWAVLDDLLAHGPDQT
ncbi:succinyl-diaminopimelate desuccinylase [Dermatobacter hominis]|uniref:succinyl-diaminopimelate desuccinylase n=1 Tax=Dermatobacter hominis TaxID=2884263 RepID=UPI001D11ECAC|nr:succinyl-diaminopimelate desuccinylase [Dermatobacter hominis]UDY36812.1 succinyl-diaminopimelate desuccinylase [Dermatobacter hominis]